MIYQLPAADQPVDQGDIIDGCPILQVALFDPENAAAPEVACSISRVVVLTQTCDLAHQRTQRLSVAVVHKAQFLVEQKIIKAADVRGPIRAARVYGWYFLPADVELGLDESIVDLRQLHTVPLDVLKTLCKCGSRKARIQPLYREHLAKHFADTYSRIGLPASKHPRKERCVGFSDLSLSSFYGSGGKPSSFRYLLCLAVAF